MFGDRDVVKVKGPKPFAYPFIPENIPGAVSGEVFAEHLMRLFREILVDPDREPPVALGLDRERIPKRWGYRDKNGMELSLKTAEASSRSVAEKECSKGRKSSLS